MGLGQTVTSILFFGLLTIMFLNAYRTINYADTQLLTAEVTKTAMDLGRSLMSEILTKRFDEGWYQSSSYAMQWNLSAPPLTPSSKLGPDWPWFWYRAVENITLPDVYPNFRSVQAYDDVDDYDGYVRIDSANGFSGFRDSVIVYYVDATQSPPRITSNLTWYKQIDVYVTNTNYLLGPSNTPVWLKLTTFVTNMRKG